MALALTEAEIKILESIFKKYFVANTEVWVFGSRATGTHKPFSDLDLVIKTDKKMDRKILNQLDYELEESSLAFKVDLIDWQRINKSFKNALAEQKMLRLFSLKKC